MLLLLFCTVAPIELINSEGENGSRTLSSVALVGEGHAISKFLALIVCGSDCVTLTHASSTLISGLETKRPDRRLHNYYRFSPSVDLLIERLRLSSILNIFLVSSEFWVTSCTDRFIWSDRALLRLYQRIFLRIVL